MHVFSGVTRDRTRGSTKVGTWGVPGVVPGTLLGVLLVVVSGVPK